MELDNQPVPQPVPAEGDKDLGNGSVSDQFPPSEASLDHILHGIEVTEGTAQNSGLEELKLDLCVPAQPVIEPITPVSEPEEQCVISTVTQETMNQNALNSPEAIEEGIAETGELNDLHLETPSHHVTEVVCELATNNTGSSDCSTELQSCFSMESTDTSEAPKDCVVASALIQDTQITTSNPTFAKEVGCKTNSTQDSVSKTECSVQDSPIRKNIPPKKDRFPRHKVGVSAVIPLTSSQLSLQCQECHIIFRDQRSKERHLKTNHPAEYEQCILGDCAFTCYVCDRQFTCSTELLAHQRAHTEKLPFKCPICNEAFSRSSELTSHKKVHTKQDYACVECGKPCKTLTLLKYHQRMHSGERPYICIQKNCGMRFSMRQGLQRHSERHEKIDAEGTGEKIKKRRKKGSSGQKFPCPQCDAVFRTTKTQLLHIKNKHSQDKTTEAQSSTVPVLQLKPPPIITQTVNGQPQILHMQAVEPAPQQVNVVDAEQIKRLIEKLGNVQKVNQLVILPFQPQRLGSSQPQGLFQPLHVNFTQSTAQASVCEAADADKNPLEAEQTKHQTSEEMVDLQSKETVVVSQEEKTISSSENLEIQESPVELAEEQTQTDEVHLELVPVQSETCVLPNQTPVQVEMLQNDSVSEQTHATEFQNNSDTQSIAALETKNDSPLISPTETLKSHNEAENVLLPVDIIESEETVTNTEMLCSKGTQDSTDLSVELETQVLCGEGDTVKLGKPQEIKLGEPPENQAQKDHVESETEPSMVEPKSQTNETSNSQNNISKDEQPGFVLTPDQTTANLQNCLLIQKNLPAKKKRSKKQFTDKIEEANKVSGGQIPPPQKDKTASKVITKKGEKTKNKKLVVRFGPKEKKKSSKQNIIQTPKAKKKQNQQDIDKDQALILPQPDRKKGKGVESPSGGTVKSTCQINNAIDNVLASPKATQGKPQKRKIKNQNNLIKAKSAQEAHQDETLVPVRKKKKQGKTSEEDGPKKSKIRKTQSDGFQKNTHKVAELKVTESKCRPEAPEQPFIEQQALLLLKGHKQPQLKVHKLDATELEKSPPIKVRQNQAVIHKKEKTKSKSLKAAQQKKTASNENKISEHQGEPVSLEGSSVDNSLTSVSSVTKPKILRKRKAPTKIDQEIALSPPYSRLTLECQDCGKTFSEVSALQEHMASLHSADKVGLQDGFRVMAPGANEKHIQPNTFEIQVATDWDMETEVGEILGDREEHRLSFPALSPSPSLTVAPGCVEEKEQEGNKDIERSVPRLEQPPDKTPTEVCQTPTQMPVSALDKSIVPQEITGNIACDKELEKDLSKDVEPITEMSHSDLKDTVEGEIKEELPLEVNLVTVEDQNEEGNHSPQTNVSSVTKECENGVNFNAYSQPQQSAKDTNVELDQNVVHSSTETEIKQEEEEVLVHRVDDQKRVKNSATRGKKGAGRGRGKKPLGRRTSTENRSKKDMETKKDSQECQVVYQLCVLNDTREAKDKEMDKSEPNASESCLPATPEETHEEQVVFELDSVTTSVIEVVNSEDGSFSEKSRELVRDGSSPGIILEKFLTARERDPNGQSHMRQGDLDTSKVTLDYTSADVKIEERPSIQALNSLIPSEGGLMRGVQMFLVKAEDHLTLNEPVIFQAHQPMDTHRTECQDKTIDKNRDCISSDSHVVPLQSYSKQCIFYPVKEEEREHLVELSVEDQRCLNSGGFAGASSGIEECEEIRVGSEQMEMQHIYSNTEEGDTGGEQQSTQGILEFLSKSSDTDDSDNVHSEPEAETIVMSCYHGIHSNSTVRQNGMQRCSTSGGQNLDPLLTGHTEAERQLTWKPIKYFSQYFSWDTWKEISACTRGISKLPNPVTDKEVAQFVGIHIAMGTLKFPSSNLYWEDFTRVPLISDAMSASRFCELAQELRLASFGGASMETSSQQSEKKNGGQTEPGSLTSRNTSRVFSQSHSIEKAYNCTNFSRSKTDPLWKVMTLIKKVQEGCRTLKGNGNFGVDQYPLPFQRHPTHSLLHTVVISSGGLVVDFSLSVDDSNRENVVENMVSTGKDRNDGMVFLCKPELSTPSMVEHLLEAGVQSAGKVGGARGQIGDEFVSSDGKLKLFRCHHGFILSATVKEKSRSTSLVSGFERAIKSANLNRDLRSLYRTPCTNTAVSAWPQSVLWDLIDLVLVNAWLQYKQDYSDATDLLSLMSFRLEVAKALIFSSGVDAQDSLPPCPPAPKLNSDTNSGPSQVLETPLPDEVTRYDGFGHWPEQLAEGEEARCRFGGCERTSRVRCLKCCVFLCISQNHNCFLKFHSQGAS